MNPRPAPSGNASTPFRHSCESRNPEGRCHGGALPPPTPVASPTPTILVGAIRESPIPPRRERPTPFRHSCESRNPGGRHRAGQPHHQPPVASPTPTILVGAIRESPVPPPAGTPPLPTELPVSPSLPHPHRVIPAKAGIQRGGVRAGCPHHQPPSRHRPDATPLPPSPTPCYPLPMQHHIHNPAPLTPQPQDQLPPGIEK